MSGQGVSEITIPAELRALLDRLHAELAVDARAFSSPGEASPAAVQILQHSTPREIIAFALLQRAIELEQTADGRDWKDYNSLTTREYNRLITTLSQVLPGAVTGRPGLLEAIIEWWMVPKPIWVWSRPATETGLLSAVERHAKQHPVTPVMRAWLIAVRKDWQQDHKPDHRKIARINTLLGEDLRLEIDPGEAWADRAIADVAQCPPPTARAWAEFIHHCRIAAASTPSAKWLKDATRLIAGIGHAALAAALIDWFPLVDRPRTAPRERLEPWEPDYTHRIIDAHMEVLKGLCWSIPLIPDPPADLIRALGRLAISAYRKIPGLGPRAVKVGNAAVYALGQLPGETALGQLAVLRVKVKFGTAQKGIEKALNAAAARLNLPREELEELGVPSYGLTHVGRRVDILPDPAEPTPDDQPPADPFTAEIRIQGVADVELRWFKGALEPAALAAAKPIKSVPAAVKSRFAEELAELKSAAKDIAAMLPAQRDRLDAMFLERRSWLFEVWRERFLDHPLVGVFARRLIWNIRSHPEGPATAVAFLDGPSPELVDAAGRAVDVSPGSTVSLWHPVDAETQHILAWRAFFEDRQIRQPFKQAHREIYLLTDAERNTRVYSNRFAAHILRQHQFNALCGIRGWKNKLRLMVDAEYEPAHRLLRAWKIRAEYWIDGVGDNFGTDSNESGVYNHVVTDQVRFYPIDAATRTAHAGGGGYATDGAPGSDNPIPLDQVPPLVLSEVLRDVDLFVGVSSVGNNPQWADGGPEGRYHDYWWEYSFADLGETGASRKQLLQRLIPRLKIAAACSFSDKFLIVKGSLRTYKIHLGSGNILMEPNDEYLCIVPSSRDNIASGNVFLPFEGDRTLSIILSKAFMLADDVSITDPTITRQINKRLPP